MRVRRRFEASRTRAPRVFRPPFGVYLRSQHVSSLAQHVSSLAQRVSGAKRRSDGPTGVAAVDPRASTLRESASSELHRQRDARRGGRRSTVWLAGAVCAVRAAHARPGAVPARRTSLRHAFTSAGFPRPAGATCQPVGRRRPSVGPDAVGRSRVSRAIVARVTRGFRRCIRDARTVDRRLGARGLVVDAAPVGNRDEVHLGHAAARRCNAQSEQTKWAHRLQSSCEDWALLRGPGRGAPPGNQNASPRPSPPASGLTPW